MSLLFNKPASVPCAEVEHSTGDPKFEGSNLGEYWRKEEKIKLESTLHVPSMASPGKSYLRRRLSTVDLLVLTSLDLLLFNFLPNKLP